ncbi:MAG: DUF2064 domain-containing protein [Sandaracinaceae bacterium]|nr:DUF2064 domain-containing protein [Sandaracinaceae bacterium]
MTASTSGTRARGDLGARLQRNLRRALTESPRVLAVGTDSPGLPVALLEQSIGRPRHARRSAWPSR